MPALIFYSKRVSLVISYLTRPCNLHREGALGRRAQRVDLEKRMQRETHVNRVNPVTDANAGVTISEIFVLYKLSSSPLKLKRIPRIKYKFYEVYKPMHLSIKCLNPMFFFSNKLGISFP